RAGWNSDRLVKANVDEIRAMGGQVLSNATLQCQVEAANLENFNRGGKLNNTRVATARWFYQKLSETQVVGATPKGVVEPMPWWEGRLPKVPAASGGQLLGAA